MTDNAMELTGRRADQVRGRTPEPVRNVVVPSRVVQRREAILRMLDEAYRRDIGGEGGVGL